MNSTSYRVKTFRKKMSIWHMCISPLLDFILYTIQYNEHLDIYSVRYFKWCRDDLYYMGGLSILHVNAVSFSMGFAHLQTWYLQHHGSNALWTQSGKSCDCANITLHKTGLALYIALFAECILPISHQLTLINDSFLNVPNTVDVGNHSLLVLSSHPG